MDIEEFALERLQSLHENEVELNLSDSGVHPLDLQSLLTDAERSALMTLELGYGHTHGSPGLRGAIAALYADRSADEVIVTNGGAEANFLLVMTLVKPGDGVVVVTPNYLQIAGWARAAGARVLEVPLDADNGWRLDRDALEAAIGADTRLVTLCDPNNPTGTLLSAEDRAWLVELTRDAGAWLHVDEVYHGGELDQAEPPSWADDGAHVIVSNSLSKAMALPGLRIGWLCGPAEQIYRAWQRKDYTTITTAALSEAIAEIVLQRERREQILVRSRDWLRSNRALLADWIDATPGFSCNLPSAGGMAFVAYDLPLASQAFAEHIRTRASALVVPGACYGIEGHIRIGIGAPPQVLREGLARIAGLAAELAADQDSRRA